MATIKINDRIIGPGFPCFIIAEAGVNHNGDLARAKQMVQVAARSGADAVKFQTFKAEKVVAPQAPKAAYQLDSTPATESQLEMVKRLELSYEDFKELSNYCNALDVMFLSSPFDEGSADFLYQLGVAAFKLGSGEITNFPLLRHIARMGKPMIVSTGMSTLSEVRQAVDTIISSGDPPLVLLHCVSLYPAEVHTANLRAILSMGEAFSVPVGWSDHTLGTLAVMAAISIGASVVEKHFTLDKKLPGPDHQASLAPVELAKMVEDIRLLERALGDGFKEPLEEEISMAKIARKSLHLRRDLGRGHILHETDLVALRPGTGLSPSLLSEICGKKLKVDLPAGTMLSGEHFE